MINDGLKIGSRVWVVLLNLDDTNLLGIPEPPQEGIFLGLQYDIPVVYLDNDLLYPEKTRVFRTKQDALSGWEKIMQDKISTLQNLLAKGLKHSI